MRAYLTLAAAVLCCAPGPWVARLAAEPPAHANPRRTPVTELVKRVKASVVNIHSERTLTSPAGEADPAMTGSSRVNGMGTGIVLDPRGLIVTNYHVVEDVSSLRARLSDGTVLPARVLARDSENDLALLKIDPPRPLPVVPLGTAQDLMVGETVVAVGNAYGYEHTVTLGIVSAIKRDVVLNKEVSYKSLIQTDASINPGNSGGPLFNINGELVGVNVAIRAGAQGIAFAIPVDGMLRATADMLSSRKRGGPWHGVVGKDDVQLPAAGDVEQVDARTEGFRRRLLVDRAEPGTPAARAGLQAGDVVVRANDVPVSCALDLERALLDARPGDKAALVVRRKDADLRLELVLQGGPATPQASDLIWRRLGVRVQAVPAETVTRVHTQLHGGLAITEVRGESAAARAGLQRGDVLVGLHQWEMLAPDNVVFVLTHNDLPSFNPLRFYIIRGGQVHRGMIPQVD